MNGDPNRMPRVHGGMPFYDGRGGFEHHGGHHWLMLVFFVVLLVALLLVAASAVRWAFAGRTSLAAGVAGSVPADDALSVLRLRYARGEVGRDDFLLAHGDLGGGLPPAEPHPA
jgi:uncharacterized membrane protein